MRLLSPTLLGVAGLLTVALLLAPPAVAQSPCSHYASPTGGGSGLSQGSPFRIPDFWGVAQPGSTLCLLDGTYTDGIEVFATPHGAPGSPITIRALNDGGVFLDGQFGHNTIFFNGASYITVQGVDAGNSPRYNNPLNLTSSDHITVQRVCVWNSDKPTFAGGDGSNQHVIGIGNSHDLLLEDLCGFGYGRNTFITGDDATKNNVVRRVWVRWDGWEDNNGGTCPGPTIQTQYYTYHTNDIYENFISIFSGALYGGAHPTGFPCGSLGAGWVTRAGMMDTPVAGGATAGPSWVGYIAYGYPDHNDILTPNIAVGMANRWGQITLKDVFLDGRFARDGTVNMNFYACDLTDPADANSYLPGPCSQVHEDRITSLRNPGQHSTMAPSGADATNLSDCTDLASCPNFYTGDGPGTGSRACYQYQNGTLTSTPLWPWPMDDRIKQALQRSGIGPSLSGSAGPGYAAGTVTSEIVARYGAVPAPCLRGGGGAPTPVAGGGGSVPTNLRLRSIP